MFSSEYVFLNGFFGMLFTHKLLACLLGTVTWIPNVMPRSNGAGFLNLMFPVLLGSKTWMLPGERVWS